MADIAEDRIKKEEEEEEEEDTPAEPSNDEETESPSIEPKVSPTAPIRGKSHKHDTAGVQVDLSKVKNKTTPHTKPSLPTPLTQYGLDEKKQARAKARAYRVSKEKKRKRSSTFYGDDEREREKERLKDEKYMQVLEDLRVLRNYYYSEYRDLLDTKVEKQRKEIRSKTEAQQRKRQEQDERDREASHKVKKRHQHHRLQHDDTYLKNVPKSDAYLILGLQEKMVKEGKLRCQEDLDKFWMEMRKPEIFFTHFPNGLGVTSGLNNRIAASSKRSTEDDMLPRTLSQIAESKESSRPTTHDTWAVTQRFHHIHSRRAESASPHKNMSLSPSKQAAMELERRFPKLEMPPLHCFNMDLGEKPPDPEEIRLKMELKTREKQRRKFLKKLHKMHQLAMANTAAATSTLKSLGILDGHTDLAFLMEGPDLTDLISDYYWEDSRPTVHTRSAPCRDRLPPISDETRPSQSPIPEASSEKSSTEISPRSESLKSKRDQHIERQLVVYEPQKPFPLTMEEVREKNRVIEAKILSSYWTNYMQSGKPVFLTSSS